MPYIVFTISPGEAFGLALIAFVSILAGTFFLVLAIRDLARWIHKQCKRKSP